MRVILTHDIAHYAGRFFKGLVVLQTHVFHGVKHAAVYGLQPVTHIGKRAADDNAHGILNIGRFHFFAYIAIHNIHKKIFRR